uniref:Modulator of VRAC current 1 n=1 Tax=Leptobrachium leishanense TaxID=445787 RepID=A0A8C5PD23_9ANUR
MSLVEEYAKEYDYDRMDTLERSKQKDKRYNVDVKCSDIQLSDKLQPCVLYKNWIFSLLVGSCLLVASGFSLYLGNVFPSEMDYLRCAAGSVSIPCVTVYTAFYSTLQYSLLNKSEIMHYQTLFVSTFSITTTCLIWCGCKLAINPTAININYNLLLLILMEILMAVSVIISARSNIESIPESRVGAYGLHTPFATSRFIKCFKSVSPQIVEIVVGVCAVFGGVVALNFDALVHSPILYVSIFWVLAACFPCAVASHVAAEYPSNCSVEVLIASSSITSPLLFTTSAYLSFSIEKTVDIFKVYPPAVNHFHDILLLLLMLILLLQAVLTSLTAVHCVHYKSQVRMFHSSWDMSTSNEHDYRNNEVSTVVRELDSPKCMEQMIPLEFWCSLNNPVCGCTELTTCICW